MRLIVIGMISADKVVVTNVADSYKKSLIFRLFLRKKEILEYFSVTFCIRSRQDTFGFQLFYDIR